MAILFPVVFVVREFFGPDCRCPKRLFWWNRIAEIYFKLKSERLSTREVIKSVWECFLNLFLAWSLNLESFRVFHTTIMRLELEFWSFVELVDLLNGRQAADSSTSTGDCQLIACSASHSNGWRSPADDRRTFKWKKNIFFIFRI